MKGKREDSERKSELRRFLTYIFLAVEVLLYIAYVSGDIFAVGQPKILKFIAVAVLALFSLFAGKEKENKAVTAIFFFTLLADVFFVLMNKAMYGIAVYIIIQLIHTVRLSYVSEKDTKKELLKRIIPGFCLGFIGSFIGPQIALILTYGTCIAVNIAHCAETALKEKSPENIRYMIGMIVLVIGDIGVGLRNMQASFVTEEMMNIAYIITWITYVPSLILILSATKALSLSKNKCTEKHLSVDNGKKS